MCLEFSLTMTRAEVPLLSPCNSTGCWSWCHPSCTNLYRFSFKTVAGAKSKVPGCELETDSTSTQWLMLPAPEAMQLQEFIFFSSSHSSLKVLSKRYQGNPSQQLIPTHPPLAQPGFAFPIPRQLWSNGPRHILLTKVSLSSNPLVTILNFVSHSIYLVKKDDTCLILNSHTENEY